MHRRIILLFIILSLFLISGCTPQSSRNDPIASPTSGTTPSIFPETNSPLSTTIQEQNRASDTPTNTIPIKTIIATPLDRIFLFSRDLMSVYFFLDPFNMDRKSWVDPENIRYPRDSTSIIKTLRFSSHRNLVAYQTTNGEVWLVDHMMNRSTKVYELPPDINFDAHLVWTPDDIHLIIDRIDPELTDLIYHTNNGTVEEWNNRCNDLVISPKTNKIAVACRSNNHDNYSYIEWGGEIWTDIGSPETVLVHVEPGNATVEDPIMQVFSLHSQFQSFSINLVSGWSADGAYVAFFDPLDRDGALKIFTSGGTLVNTIPHKAYWQDPSSYESIPIPGLPIQWSDDGKTVLIYGTGTQQDRCSAGDDTDNTSPDGNNQAKCWQILDVQTSEIIWNSGNLLGTAAISFENAALSGDGNLLALNSYYPAGNKLLVIDLEQNEIIMDAPLSVSDFHWGTSE